MIVEHLLAPDAERLHDFLREHLLEPGRWLKVLGTMEIVYFGRASSTADAGDHLMLLKPDRSLQVHAPRGLKPRNWQPKIDDLSTFVDDGRAVLVAERSTPHEIVRITFLDVHLAVASQPVDDGGLVLHGSEAEMQRTLAQRPEWIEEGLTVLDVELPVSVGGLDLYARDASGQLVVVELKRARAGQEAVHQLQRYVAAVRNLTGEPVRGIVAAPAITAPALGQLAEAGLEFRALDPLAWELVGDPGSEQPSLFS